MSDESTVLAAKVLSDYLNFRESINVGKSILTLKKDDVVFPTGKAWIEVTKDNKLGWVSFEFVDYFDQEIQPVKIPVVVEVKDEPVWITWAKQQLGVKEVPGAGDNPIILAWYHLTTLPEDLWHDSTAWCAVFVNAAMFLNGIKGNRSARAVDWLNFGLKVDIPKIGDIVVFDWQDGGHHVAFVLSVKDEIVKVIGGNQSNGVTITEYSEEYIMGYRRPK